MNILSLRSLINGLLSSELGTYTFSSGQTTPSICVLPDNVFGMNYPPNGVTVSGLEVVLVDSFNIKHRPILRGSYNKEFVEITLKQWDITKTTVAATNLLVYGIKEDYLELRPRMIADRNLDNIESQVIYYVRTKLCGWD
jgi:hypothetical protein